jgi:2-polyprenyl-6-hydroxyphenyl methylase / 3-demethylubiquinone-9 3-methyltransferase
MTQFANTDQEEIQKFDDVANIWWDLKGEMGTLHVINPLRTEFITRNLDMPKSKIVDVGCGGGILSEALAKAGAQVTAIDLSELSIKAAQHHAKSQGLNIDYRYESVEDLAARQAGQYDAVTCMEMLEHVPDPNQTIAACAKLLKPGGHAYFSTINRTLKAGFMVIFGGEYILRLLPRGTHTYSKLIRPDELRKWSAQNGLEFQSLASLIYNPFNKTFKVKYVEDNNYMAHFIKKQ